MLSFLCLFVLSVFQRDVLDEILDLIESVSENLSTYSSSLTVMQLQSQLHHEISVVDFLGAGYSPILHCHHDSHGCIVQNNILSIC